MALWWRNGVDHSRCKYGRDAGSRSLQHKSQATGLAWHGSRHSEPEQLGEKSTACRQGRGQDVQEISSSCTQALTIATGGRRRLIISSVLGSVRLSIFKIRALEGDRLTGPGARWSA